MQISRLPVVSAHPSTEGAIRAPRDFGALRDETVQRAAGSRRTADEDSGLQGEVLSGREALYQSTHSFLFERAMVRARYAGAAQPTSARTAAGEYLSHAQQAGYPEAAQGRRVDIFI